MSKQDCHDAVYAVLENVRDANGLPVSENEIITNSLDKACSLINELLESEDDEFEFAQAIVSDGYIFISFDCDCFYVINAKPKENMQVMSLFELCDSFSFSQVRNDKVRTVLKIKLS